MLVDHRVVHATDRLLDPGDLAAGRIDGAGGGGRLGPVPEDRPGSVHFLPGPDDGDDLDGSALSLECVPEAAVRAERRKVRDMPHVRAEAAERVLEQKGPARAAASIRGTGSTACAPMRFRSSAIGRSPR